MFKFFAPLTIALLLCHCTFRVVSPPSRLSNTESVRVADSGQVVVGAGGFGAGAVFSAGLEAASIRIAKGVSSRREIALSPVFGASTSQSHDPSNPAPYFAGLHGDVKTELPWDSRWFVANHQFGGGLLYSEAGEVFSLEGGFATGLKKGWLRPMVNTNLWLSLPFMTKTIYNRDTEKESVERKRLTSTLGMHGSLGLEFCPHPRFSVLGSMGAGVADSETDVLSFLELGLGLRTAF